MAIRLNESKSCCEQNVIIQGLNCHHTINTCPGRVIHIYKACYLGTKDLIFFDSWIVVATVHNLVAGFILTPRGRSRTQGTPCGRALPTVQTLMGPGGPL